MVAPGAPDVPTLEARLEQAASLLGPFADFGPSNFLVGSPDFDFSAYETWISERFPPSRFRALERKFGGPTQFAIGAFVQALGGNAGLEQELRELGGAAQVIVGAGLSDLPTSHAITLELHRARRRWDRFWTSPERNDAHRRHLEGEHDPDAPPDPGTADELERDEAEERYWAYWAARSEGLRAYLVAQAEIEAVPLGADSEAAKAVVIRNKQRGLRELAARWGAPPPPWASVRADLLWNIPSSPAAQISMLGRIRGPVYAPYAACSTFGYALKLGMDAIRSGQARLVVVGASEPEPTALSVGTFYDARVLAHDGELSRPLTGLKGTHVAGGAAVWIIGDLDHYLARGWTPLGAELLAVGLSADADHIITPSLEGPRAAIERALDEAGVRPEDVSEWDLHATGTPGDRTEVQLLRDALPASVRLTARKGCLGHGMGAGGGWELTAQHLGLARGQIFPTGLRAEALHPDLRALHDHYVLEGTTEDAGPIAGKLSMGVGGLNAAVISRAYGLEGPSEGR